MVREVKALYTKQDFNPQGCCGFLEICCCRCTPIDNWMSLFQRKPSALAPLDGLRFIAVLWVYVVHVGDYSFQFHTCLRPTNMFWSIITSGDSGVDIFFVLSGFLIYFVLKREYDKYQDIDWVHFMKMRFLRIFPAMITFLVAAFIFLMLTGWAFSKAITFFILPIFFVNNLVGKDIHYSHLWSISVEM